MSDGPTNGESAPRRRFRVAISGASGLIGQAVSTLLEQNGYEVFRLVRSRPQSAHQLEWDPANGLASPDEAEDLDALVHLAGENIAAGRWTARRKRRIRDSRIQGTAALLGSLRKLETPPRLVLCASAVGFYGARVAGTVDENAPAGRGFLAEVCEQWESAATSSCTWQPRLVHLRFGVVLSAAGGALAKMLPLFRWGLGGRLGNGKQWMSWISLHDAGAAMLHLIAGANTSGPVNLTAPNPVRNRDFTAALAKVLRRPAFFPVPSWTLRLALGEMANETLLSSCRVTPGALLSSGFRFRHERVEDALAEMLHR